MQERNKGEQNTGIGDKWERINQTSKERINDTDKLHLINDTWTGKLLTIKMYKKKKKREEKR